MELKRIRAASFATLLFVCACSKPAGTSTDGGATASNGTAQKRSGVKVPLPEGWRAELGPEQSLLAGPAGRTILRVDLRPGAAREFPSPDALERAFAAGMPVTRIERERVIDSADFVGLRLDLSPPETDGGVVHHHDVFIGAKKIAKDLFLCATTAGSTEAELDLAENSCAELSWSGSR